MSDKEIPWGLIVIVVLITIFFTVAWVAPEHLGPSCTSHYNANGDCVDGSDER